MTQRRQEAMSVEQALELGKAHHHARRLAEAEAVYRQVLAVHPNHPDALHLMGAIAYDVGQQGVAEQLVRRAISIQPGIGPYHNTLGLILLATGRAQLAADSFRTALQLRPDLLEFHYNLGNALRQLGQIAEATEHLRLAADARPDLALARVNLGVILAQQDRLDEAIIEYQRALQSQPNLVEAHFNLANAARRTGQFDAAADEYRRTLQLDPKYTGAWINLGNVLKETGELDEALDCFNNAIKVQPKDPWAHSNLLFAMQFHWKFSPQEIFQEHLRWRQIHADPLKSQIRPHDNDRNPDRRLRIGYVSGDFKEHSVAVFMLPLLKHHDPAQVEVYCYSNVKKPDHFTARIRQLVHAWRDIADQTDDQVAQMIRADRIDILVDLSLHSADHRLLVLARKPAPVQATYLAYCSTSGLDTIDYRLTDPQLDPPGVNDAFYSEKSIHLPQTYWCYGPEADSPDVGPLPALANGYITFGCLNSFSKLTLPIWQMWIELLKAVPNSRLILYALHGRHRQKALDLVAGQGIDPQRVGFVGHAPMRQYLQHYHQIDIGLDPFPYNGGTTTCDALWMGVPVISLAGERAVSRAGLTLLTNLGLPELVANDQTEYVKLAADLAGNLERLSQLRQGLRGRMQASPLMDAGSFARNIESAYRQMWRTWCRSQAFS